MEKLAEWTTPRLWAVLQQETHYTLLMQAYLEGCDNDYDVDYGDFLDASGLNIAYINVDGEHPYWNDADYDTMTEFLQSVWQDKKKINNKVNQIDGRTPCNQQY